ncbi:MAG: biotin/lipoyl-binding protein, partial [Anderseniella sp.]
MSDTTRKSMFRYQLAGFAGIVAIMGSVVGWSVLTEIRGAVIAPGSMVVDGNTKRVQHRDGGIVAEIKVRDGDMVKAGDLLVRLDPTETRAELAIIDTIRTEWVAKAARLRAQRDGDDTLVFDEELEVRRSEPVIGKLLSGQERLFASQTASLKGRIKQLRER